jgi:hypothetical protein
MRCKSNDVVAHIIPKVLYIKTLDLIPTGITLRVFVCLRHIFYFLPSMESFAIRKIINLTVFPWFFVVNFFYLSLPRSNLLVSGNFLLHLPLDRKCHSGRMDARTDALIQIGNG